MTLLYADIAMNLLFFFFVTWLVSIKQVSKLDIDHGKITLSGSEEKIIILEKKCDKFYKLCVVKYLSLVQL